jgi:hypothetical protein
MRIETLQLDQDKSVQAVQKDVSAVSVVWSGLMKETLHSLCGMDYGRCFRRSFKVSWRNASHAEGSEVYLSLQRESSWGNSFPLSLTSRQDLQKLSQWRLHPVLVPPLLAGLLAHTRKVSFESCCTSSI